MPAEKGNIAPGNAANRYFVTGKTVGRIRQDPLDELDSGQIVQSTSTNDSEHRASSKPFVSQA
jgi:hypothetical protein